MRLEEVKANVGVKEKVIHDTVKIIRQTLFRTIAIAIGITAMGFCSRGEREIRLNSKYSKDSW